MRTTLSPSTKRVISLIFSAGLALVVACGSHAQPAAPTFGGQGAVVDPGPAASTVSAKTAPTDPCAVPAPASEDARLENFEDGDNRLFGGFEREGYWYIATDHTPGSTVFPPDGAFQTTKLPEREATLDNQIAAHFTAAGEKDWGATLGTTLRHRGADSKCALNAGNFRGLRFRARGKGTVSLRFGVPETISSEYGGRCSEHCWDLHGVTLHLSEDWSTREVRWEDLQQAGWGPSVRFDPKRLLQIDFMATPANLPVDLWIDDLSWIPSDPSK